MDWTIFIGAIVFVSKPHIAIKTSGCSDTEKVFSEHNKNTSMLLLVLAMALGFLSANSCMVEFGRLLSTSSDYWNFYHHAEEHPIHSFEIFHCTDSVHHWVWSWISYTIY